MSGVLSGIFKRKTPEPERKFPFSAFYVSYSGRTAMNMADGEFAFEEVATPLQSMDRVFFLRWDNRFRSLRVWASQDIIDNYYIDQKLGIGKHTLRREAIKLKYPLKKQGTERDRWQECPQEKQSPEVNEWQDFCRLLKTKLSEGYRIYDADEENILMEIGLPWNSWFGTGAAQPSDFVPSAVRLLGRVDALLAELKHVGLD